MADHSKIEWTDATWNPVTGCSVVSPGCTNCYAMRLAGTRLQHHPSRAGLTTMGKSGPVWNGAVRLNEDWLDQPLRWRRPRRIFVCAHGDLFHENVPDAWIDRVFAVMALSPQHSFQVLTKRAARMREYVDNLGRAAMIASATFDLGGEKRFRTSLNLLPLRNVWVGVSAEDQARADLRIPELLATRRVALRFVSAEPLLGPVDLTKIDRPVALGGGFTDALAGAAVNFLGWRIDAPASPAAARLDWVIAGGESGPGARPMHPDWARGLRDQCRDAGVPFFFKQWGAWAPRSAGINEPSGWDGTAMRLVGKAAAGRLLDGVAHDELPSASSAPPRETDLGSAAE